MRSIRSSRGLTKGSLWNDHIQTPPPGRPGTPCQANPRPHRTCQQSRPEVHAENPITTEIRSRAQEVPETGRTRQGTGTSTGLLRLREGCTRETLQPQHLSGESNGAPLPQMWSKGQTQDRCRKPMGILSVVQRCIMPTITCMEPDCTGHIWYEEGAWSVPLYCHKHRTKEGRHSAERDLRKHGRV